MDMMARHGMHTIEQRTITCFCLRSGARHGGGEQEHHGGEERPDGGVASWTHASCCPLCAACFCVIVVGLGWVAGTPAW